MHAHTPNSTHTLACTTTNGKEKHIRSITDIIYYVVYIINGPIKGRRTEEEATIDLAHVKSAIYNSSDESYSRHVLRARARGVVHFYAQ